MGSWQVLALVHRMFQNSHAEIVKALFMGMFFYPHMLSCLHELKAINTFKHKQSRGGNPTGTPAVRALKMTEADRAILYPDRKSMAFGSAQPALTLLGLPEPCHRYGSEVSAAGWGMAATQGEEMAPGRTYTGTGERLWTGA